MRELLVAAVLLPLAGCAPLAGHTVAGHPAAAAGLSAGPSASQLAHGHWVKMAVPPIRLCRPFAVWDGSALIVIESGIAPCHPAAAVFCPAANRWAKIAAPPRAARQGEATGQAWGLAGSRWQPQPSLPPVRHGWYVAAPAAVIGGSVYVLAHEFHGRFKEHNISGSSRLLRLAGSGWTVVPLPPAAQGWAYFLTALDGSLLATGTGCPILECMEEVGRAAIITPGARTHAMLLSPPGGLGIPFPQGIATGPRAVVVTYSPGGNRLYAERTSAQWRSTTR